MKFIVILLNFIWLSTFSQSGRTTIGTIPSSSKQFNKIYAVIVGISKYEDKSVNQLQYADKDAEVFYRFLKTAYPQKTNNGNNLKLFRNNEALRPAINDALNWLIEEAQEGDLIIFYYAGHGGYEGNKKDKPGYIYTYRTVPSNLYNDSYELERLNRILNNDISGEKKATTICILDACHSSNDGNTLSIYDRVNFEKQTNIIKIFSSLTNQVSIEDSILCNGHGVFTYYLIKGLLLEADRNKDSRVSISELQNYLQTNVEDYTSNRQTPKVLFENNQIFLTDSTLSLSQDFSCYSDLLASRTTSVKPTEVKSANDIDENRMNSQARNIYQKLKKSLESESFTSPNNNNAIHYLSILKDSEIDRDILETIERVVIYAFIEYSSTLIIDYINEKPLAPYWKYEMSSKMVDYCLKSSLIDNKDNLKAKKIWLDAYTFSRKIGEEIIKDSDNNLRKQKATLIPKLKQAISLSPNSAYLYNTLGYFYKDINQLDSARVYYKKALEIAPNWTYPLNNLGLITLGVQNKIEIFKKTIETNPNFYIGYWNIAIQYKNKNDYENYKLYLDSALALMQDSKEIYPTELSSIYREYAKYYQDKDREKSIDFFNKSLTLREDSTSDKYVDMANFYTEYFYWDKADSLIKLAKKVNPFNDDIYSAEGYLLQQRKQYKSSINVYQKAFSLDSFNTNALIKCSYANRMIKFYEVDTDFQKAALNNALAFTNLAIEIDSSDIYSLVEKAAILAELKDTASAVSYYLKSINIDSNNAFIYYSWSFLVRDRNPKLAIELVKHALKLSSVKNEEYLKTLGNLYGKIKDKQNVLLVFKFLEILNPASHEYKLYLGDAFRNDDKLDSALLKWDESAALQIKNYKLNDTEVVSFFKEKIIQMNDRFSYYVLGNHYLMKYEKSKDRKYIDSAYLMYNFGIQCGYEACYNKLKAINGKFRNIPMEEMTRMENIFFPEFRMKRFIMPIKRQDNTEQKVPLFIHPFPKMETNVLFEESERIKWLYGGDIKGDIVDSFNKIWKISKENNKDYLDLCVYALGKTEN